MIFILFDIRYIYKIINIEFLNLSSSRYTPHLFSYMFLFTSGQFHIVQCEQQPETGQDTMWWRTQDMGLSDQSRQNLFCLPESEGCCSVQDRSSHKPSNIEGRIDYLNSLFRLYMYKYLQIQDKHYLDLGINYWAQFVWKKFI